MDYNHIGWLLVALAAIDTSGGGYGGRDVNAKRDYIGRDRVSIYADQDVWRSNVARDLTDLREENAQLRTWMLVMMILIAGLFLFGFVATALTIRQFDQQWSDMKDLDSRIDNRYYAPPFPTP